MEGFQDSYNSSISQFPQSSRPVGIDNSSMYEQSYPHQFYGGYQEVENQESGGEYMELAQHPSSCAMPPYPQPSRPIDIDYMNMFDEQSYPYTNKFYGDYHGIENQESGGEHMELAQHPCSCAMPQIPQYPQPSRPFYIDCTNMFEQQSYPYQFYGDYQECCHKESVENYVVSDDELFRMLGEIYQENDGSNDHEIFRKFFSRVKKEVHFDRLENFFKLVNQENGFNPQVHQQRGITIKASSTNGNLKHKLERFKVKNLNLGGVVKKEKQSSSV